MPRPMHIGLPPRFTLTGLESNPTTPSPQTPQPYLFAATPTVQCADPLFARVKRLRDESEEPLTPALDTVDWTDEEIDTLQSTLMHPYRPLDTSFPPGELPPAKVIDELASQVLKFAFRSSPNKKRSEEQEEEGWKHGWDVTRQKLFDLALAESKQDFGGHGRAAVLGKTCAGAGGTRPGLKRVDSMDFLDQREDEDGDVGRTMRLSTSLQNSAKQEPLPKLERSSSTGAIQVVTVERPPLMRKPSSRSGGTRTPRPSLLQRGRSFTAEDLAVEVETLKHTSGKDNGDDARPHANEAAAAPRQPTVETKTVLMPPGLCMTRSRSSSVSSSSVSSMSSNVLAVPVSLSPVSCGGLQLEADKRAAKKVRGIVPGQLALTNLGPSDGGLRSPFEEPASAFA